MPTRLNDPSVKQFLADAKAAALSGTTRTVVVHGQPRAVPVAFPSPTDWRDHWIYFLFLDRFNNAAAAPAGEWNRRYAKRQGGTFAGVTAQLDYLQNLGCGAIWMTPVLKNPRPDWDYNYHGYAAQDFLNIDERFASDGTPATAERELTELVDQAHARGIYVILDIVLNHSGRVFDYVVDGVTHHSVADKACMDRPLGQELPVRWLNGYGLPRSDWENGFPAGTTLSADDAVFPEELRNHLFFRRRGSKLTDAVPKDGSGNVVAGAFVPGDFDTMRQLVVEYDATVPGQEELRRALGRNPVLSVLVRAHAYLIARYGFDGFRIDTVKYVHPQMIEYFGNAIREFALGIGKKNFFTFAEVYDDEKTIAAFVGRNGKDAGSFGVDAALDFPLFYKLPSVAKGFTPVESLRQVFEARKAAEKDLLSTHGDAGQFFVSFLGNHDQKERFNHPQSHPSQITLGYALMFGLQGIPSVYYGDEQGLHGTQDAQGKADLTGNESSREALWGKPPVAFDQSAPFYQALQKISQCRRSLPALRFGRLYFREVSGNGQDFGHSSGLGGVVAFSRVLGDTEVVVAANTDVARAFRGFILVDPDLSRQSLPFSVQYSNAGKTGTGQVQWLAGARIHHDGQPVWSGEVAALYVELEPMEVQILA
ncbi:MAG: alpha-amylase [Opitutaceae bacterium]|nr:alpha-amylase [Opitutaceae bacterium]